MAIRAPDGAKNKELKNHYALLGIILCSLFPPSD